MQLYKARTLISGYRLGDTTGAVFVAIPSTYINNDVTITYNKKSIMVKANTPPLYQKSFVDQFGRSQTYTLYYYHWTPSASKKEKKSAPLFDTQPEINFDTRVKLQEAWKKASKQ